MNYKPTHAQIAQRAQKIWLEHGSPWGRDDEIWLEAEHQLAAGKNETSAALVDRVKAETAAESSIEYLISPPVSQDEAVKAALRTKK